MTGPILKGGTGYVATTTVDGAGKATMPRKRIDETALAAEREARYLRRKARIDADPNLDPGLRAAYLDRTILNSDEQAAELGLHGDSGAHYISELRGGRSKSRQTDPHPSALPKMDVILGYAYGRPKPGLERGRLIEWAIKRGTHRFDRATGRLVRKPGGIRVGRPRAGRATLSHPYVPGTPRKSRTREYRQEHPE